MFSSNNIKTHYYQFSIASTCILILFFLLTFQVDLIYFKYKIKEASVQNTKQREEDIFADVLEKIQTLTASQQKFLQEILSRHEKIRPFLKRVFSKELWYLGWQKGH